jgi:hypothetical protein
VAGFACFVTYKRAWRDSLSDFQPALFLLTVHLRDTLS